MIKVPYTVTADIAKYEGEAFNSIPDLEYIKQKQIEINILHSHLGYTQFNNEPLVKDLSKYCNFKETNDIKKIALQLEEDVAILYNGKLVSMYFCFPSGFSPAEKIGQTFMDLHSPVADNEKLQRASGKVVEMMAKPGAKFRRHVWTLTTSPNLSRHPYYKSTEPQATTLDKVFFRKETQTTVGYGDGRTTFFFVKVEVMPFTSLPIETQQHAIDSINTMSETVLTYKNLHGIKQLINS